jgi:hypothetical protein
MKSQISDLVAMHDVDTLYDLMAEDDDWMTQLDAAEALVKLGDRRGLDFLLSAGLSEDKETREVAKEILDSPQLARMREDLESEEKREHQAKIDAGKKRLAKGRKVFRYKMVYLAASEILDEDTFGDGFDVPALTEHGLEGWEVVNIVPRRRQILTGAVDDTFTGAYFLLKKEVNSEDAAELDEA